MTIAPGEGERRAQRGLVAQYRVAAEKIYALIEGGWLHAVGIADPEADTLDDIQVIRRQGAQLVLDAYQVKWSGPGEILTDGSFVTLLAELVGARETVVAAATRRAQDGEAPVNRVTAHVYTSKVASTAVLRDPTMRGSGRSLQGFLDCVWRPAERELVRSLADIDPVWHPYVERLAKGCGLTPDTLLALGPDLRIETGRELEEEVLDPHDWQTKDRLDDLVQIRAKLQDLVTARHVTHVWLSAAELVSHLGDEWAARWRPRQEHVFPTRGPYEPLARTHDRLRAALHRYDQGYVVLTGSPGCGKSTLLTNMLRADDRVAARYYAYVPDNDNITRGEASAFLHDLYLAISGRQGRHVPAPRSNSLDLLRLAFREELGSLGEQARRNNRTEIVLIDGLDHVERDPAPHDSLLSELPMADDIPDGVVFVIGTRGVGDLPTHVRRGVRGERQIEVEPLPRAAVMRLCEQASLPQLGERIFELSAGHPLLAQTYLALASGVEPEQRAAALAELPPSGGQVWDFYESIWEGLTDDVDVVALLAVVSRLRGTIRLSWLNQTGAGRGEVERLTRLDYLFERSGSDRWTFFHSSFREFLRRRTAELGGEFSEDLHRSHHEALAERCRRSNPETAERFERLFHLLEGGMLDTLLAEATPAFFREQLDGLRPREAVRADIALAVRALADCHEALGIVRLSLAANELHTRSYQFPEGAEFPRLLVAIGQPGLAIAHVAEIDNATAGNDRIATAMDLVIDLHDDDLGAEAERLLDLYEPLEWFGARPSSRHAPLRGPRESLAGWARAAAVLHGGEYVLEASAALRSPPGRDEHERYDQDDLANLRAEMMWVAASELFHRERIDEVIRLRDGLGQLGDPGRDAFVLLDLHLAPVGAADAAEERRALDKLDVEALPYWGKIELAERLLTLGDSEGGREHFAQLSEPSVPERDYTRLKADEPRWDAFYRYWRLKARLGLQVDPVRAVPSPEKEYLEQLVLAARHVVAFAELEGRQQAGQSVGAAEIVSVLKRMHAFWATKAGRHEDRRPGPARALVSRRAIVVAERLGPAALQNVFACFRARWDEQPVHLWWDGPDLISRFGKAGIGEVSVRAALADLEAFHDQDGCSPDDWIPLGQAWARAGDLDGAVRCCKRAVRSTLALTSDKDLQLGTWTRLLMPLMEGSEGDQLASEFAAALTALSQDSYGGSPDHAARIMLELTAPSHPLRAWELAKGFLETQVLNPDDVIEAFLATSAAEPGVHWWVAAELLVAIGANAPSKALQRAAQSNPAAAQRWLPVLLERVAIEGRPSSRREWRSSVRRALSEVGLADELKDDDLEVGDEAPSRTATPEPEAQSEPEPTVEELLRTVEERDRKDYLRSEPVRMLVRRLAELNNAQVTGLERCVADTDDEPRLRAALATRATAAGDLDLAWEQGARAIAASRAGDWSRNWAGGPMLELVPALRAIDHERTNEVTFSRFADLATSVDYFLGQVGAELADYVDVFEFPPEATAREVLAVATALLRDVSPLPDPSSFSADGVHRAAPPAEIALALERLVGWFLASPYFIAWQPAQRAILALLADGAGVGILEAALGGEEQEVLRACAVIETAATHEQAFEELVPELERLALAESLAERGAAIKCLQALGQSLPVAATQPAGSPLPPALRIELPPRGQPRSIVSGLAQTAGWFRFEIEALAEASEVDEDALFEHVLIRAEELAESKDAGDERASRQGGMLGWGFVKPSVQVMRRAIGEVAAELVDAGQIAPLRALAAARLWPLYDTTLLRMRPARRPREVATFIPHDQRNSLYNVSLDVLARDAEARPARFIGDWQVIGERSEVALLDRAGHYEHRWSGVLLDQDDCDALVRSDGRALNLAGVENPSELLHDLTRSTAALNPLTADDSSPKFAIAGNIGMLPIASPSGWLALHSALAHSLGLDPDPANPFAWLLNDEAAVRSIWWRSGYDKWQPWSDADEVGEGWLVVASPALIERWRELHRSEQGWIINTGRRGDSDSAEGEIQASGVWEV